MTASSSDFTYRVWGLPSDASETVSEKILSTILDKGSQKSDPEVLSLGLDPYAFGRNVSKVATVTFAQIPEILQEGAVRTFDVREYGKRYKITIDRDFLGFTPLNSVKDDEEHKTDIIAVSGLSSHPFGSWKDRRGTYMWLRDDLAQEHKGARVLLYGYDTALVKSESFQDIDDIARQLTSAINLIRKLRRGETNVESRPIIFIAHSLGGLVVKEAICQASKDNEHIHNFISIHSLLLFGVPNQGIKTEFWYPIVKDQPNKSLVQNLEPGAIYLRKLEESFCSEFSFLDSRIFSIYETMKSKTAKEDLSGKWTLTGKTEILITRESAIGRYPQGIKREFSGFNQNHADLPKFSSPHDQNYRHVKTYLDDVRTTAVLIIQRRFQNTGLAVRPIDKQISTSDSHQRSDASKSLRNSDPDLIGSPHEYDAESPAHDLIPSETTKVMPTYEDSQLSEHTKASPADVKMDEFHPNSYGRQIENLCTESGTMQTGAGSLTTYSAATNRDMESLTLPNKETDTSVVAKDGCMPLYLASHNGHLEVVKLLLDEGANLNTTNDGWTPLNIASANGHFEVVKLLLDKGADLTTANKNGFTPLNSASHSGHLDVVKLLLDKGADLNTTNDGWTPLNIASANGHFEVVKLLLDKGADLTTANKNGITPLNSASHSGHLDVVKLLLDKGADLNTTNDGWTPLNFASANGHFEVVKLLLNKGADLTTANKNGFTPLNSASHSGHLDVVKLLLDKGADLTTATNIGYTPLYLASYSGYLEVVKLLLDKGADLTTADNEGWTPLNVASQQGHFEVVKLLLNKGGLSRTP